MPLWSNWSGRQQARPVAVPFLRSEADAQALVRDAAANGTSIRVAGAGHSHAPLVISDGIIADASGLAGVIGTDTAARRAWVWAGTPIYALGRPLHDAGLALKNQGDIDRQAIAGAVATGTHGSGPALQNLSAAVTGARVVLASGETVDCAADAHSDLWQVARLNLGALGVVTRLQLQLREAYKLVERGWSEPYEALLPKLADLIAANRHFEFFWYPYNDTAIAKAIQEMSKTSKGVMAPQCGLAPGLVVIIGAHLAEQFEEVRSIKLRVGALPQHPTGLLGYAFNWSPEGVVNEYLNDCEVIEEGQHKWVSPMEWVEKIYVGGNRLEAFTTSGGLGTMCETYLGRVENLDYKSMRYPGHVELMNFFFHEILMREQRELAGEILTHAKPPVDDDVVHIHVSAEGIIDDRLMRQEYVRSYYPLEIAGRVWRAIAWTTSASVAAVIEMVSRGDLPAKGFIKQELIPLELFLATRNGGLYEAPRGAGAG